MRLHNFGEICKPNIELIQHRLFEEPFCDQAPPFARILLSCPAQEPAVPEFKSCSLSQLWVSHEMIILVCLLLSWSLPWLGHGVVVQKAGVEHTVRWQEVLYQLEVQVCEEEGQQELPD